MALMAFGQPALSLISKCIVMLIIGQIKCLLACKAYFKTSGMRPVDLER